MTMNNTETTLPPPDDRAAPKAPLTLDRVCGLSPQEFMEQYMIPGKPVVLGDAIENWPALNRWTSEFWVEQYGDRTVGIDDQSLTIEDLIQLATHSSSESPAPYYRNVRLREAYPELLADIMPHCRFCQPNWFRTPLLKPLYLLATAYGQYELFIGGEGRSFPYLHFDVPGAHTFIHQIAGQKRMVLFSPEDSPYLYQQSGPTFNVSGLPGVENVPLDEFPLYAKATRIDVELGPGDTVFMPFGWWHTARMLSFSVSLGIDVVNETNWDNVSSFITRKVKEKRPMIAPLMKAYLGTAGTILGGRKSKGAS